MAFAMVVVVVWGHSHRHPMVVVDHPMAVVDHPMAVFVAGPAVNIGSVEVVDPSLGRVDSKHS